MVRHDRADFGAPMKGGWTPCCFLTLSMRMVDGRGSGWRSSVRGADSSSNRMSVPVNVMMCGWWCSRRFSTMRRRSYGSSTNMSSPARWLRGSCAAAHGLFSSTGGTQQRESLSGAVRGRGRLS